MMNHNGERRSLAPFAWQLGHNATIHKIQEWLYSNGFEQLRDSRQVLGDLINDRIGTDDNTLIDKYIAPRLRPALVIKIQWKDGTGPGKTIRVQQRSNVQSCQRLIGRA
jgi:hypothetical protein